MSSVSASASSPSPGGSGGGGVGTGGSSGGSGTGGGSASSSAGTVKSPKLTMTAKAKAKNPLSPTSIAERQRLQDAVNDAYKAVEALTKDLKLEREKKKGKMQVNECQSNAPPLPNRLKLRATLKGHFGKVLGIQWCPGSGVHKDKLVSASIDSSVIVWNGRTAAKSCLIRVSSAWMMTVAMSPSGSFVACGGLDSLATGYSVDLEGIPDDKRATAPVWELQRHDGYVSCCRFVSDEQLLSSSGDGSCILWDLPSREPLTNFHGHEADVLSLTPLTESTFVSGGIDCTAKVWDMRTGRCEQSHEGHESDVNSLDRFPDGQAFATGSDDHTARIFDTRCWGQVATFGGLKMVTVTSVALSLSGRLLFAGYDDAQCRIWDVMRGELLDTSLKGHTRRVSGVGVSYGGYAVATSSWDNSVKIWA